MSIPNTHPSQNEDTIAFTIMIDNEQRFQFIIKCMENVSFEVMMVKLQKTYGDVLRNREVFNDKECHSKVNLHGQIQKTGKYFINLTSQQYECIIKQLFFDKEKIKKPKQSIILPTVSEIVAVKPKQINNQTKISAPIKEAHNKNATVVPISKQMIPHDQEEEVSRNNLRGQKESEEYLTPIKQTNKNEATPKIYPQTTIQSTPNQTGNLFVPQNKPVQQQQPQQGKCCALI